MAPGIQIQINVTNRFEFCIINSIPKIPIQTDNAGGMGLNNMIRRLDLIYPGNYHYEVKIIDETKYMSILWIQ